MNKLLIIILCFCTTGTFAQDNSANRPLFVSTEFDLSFYHPGGYSKERSTIYLEQGVHYQFRNNSSLGFTMGINAYPGLLALPIGLDAQFPILLSLNKDWFIRQSIAYNLKVNDLFYRGSRYRGGVNVKLMLNDRLALQPEIGYSFIWDRYGGAALSFLAGVRLTY